MWPEAVILLLTVPEKLRGYISCYLANFDSLLFSELSFLNVLLLY